MDARKLTRIVAAIIALTACAVFAQSNFEDYKRDAERYMDADTEFEQYQARMNAGFAAYKNAADAAIARTKAEARAYFRNADVGSQTRWVEYRDDFTTRRTVDFEKNTLTVELVVPKGQTGQTRKIASELIDMILESTDEAFRRDIIAMETEAGLRKADAPVVTDTVEPSPILAPVLTDTAHPGPETVKDSVIALMKGGDTSVSPGKKPGTEVVTFSVPLPSTATTRRAEAYRPNVTKHANHRRVETALVYAVIHTESYFNPMARSSVPAFGLMQIVPKSGGYDASRLIYGKPRILAPSFLYDGDNNIMVGTAYLHLLYYEYMKAVKNPESRLYCAIAAYNTGPGNVARAFTGKYNMSDAARIVNGMRPDEVYNRLLTRLPYPETRNYLKTVSRRMNAYRGF